MDFDVEQYLGAVERRVETGKRDGQETRIVIARRVYDTSQTDLWDAIANPERLPRWFLPVEGDLRSGGHFQFKGNAGGEILVCDEPEHVGVTWTMGEPPGSWVDVFLTIQAAEKTLLTLKHEAPVDEHFWDQFGPGAVGVGWDLALLGLGMHLATGEAVDHEAAHQLHTTDNGRRFITGSSAHWATASIDAGFDAGKAKAAEKRTTAFYLGESEPEN